MHEELNSSKGVARIRELLERLRARLKNQRNGEDYDQLIELAIAYADELAAAMPTQAGLISKPRRDELIRDAVRTFVDDLDEDKPVDPERLLGRIASLVRNLVLQKALDDWKAGADDKALNVLIELSVDRFRAIASKLGAGVGASPGVTEVVNEAVLRLKMYLKSERTETANHFLRFAALCIRAALIDFIRNFEARQDPDQDGKTLNNLADDSVYNPARVAELREILDVAKEKLDARESQVFELRFILGLKKKETIFALGWTEYEVTQVWRAVQIKLEDFFKDWGRD
jgi:RNA polymerase sigma factor (sigma-70 family)